MDLYFEIEYFLLLVILSLIILLVFRNLNKTKEQKLIVTFITVSTLIYSGLGTSLNIVEKKYFFYYLVFILSINIALTITFMFGKSKKESITVIDDYFQENPKILSILTILFFLSMIIGLFTPEFRLLNLLSPTELFSISGVFESRDNMAGSSISYIANLIKINLLPFFFMYIYILKENKKRWKAIILMILWIYIDYTRIGYIGRYQMVVSVIIILIVLYEKNGVIEKKVWIFAATLFFISIPFMVAYENSRLGIAYNENLSFFEQLQSLLINETDFTKHYSFISNLNLNIISDYFKWFFTLPIPKLILPIDQLVINEVFTYLISGLVKGDSGYGIWLPSLLGEALLIYNEYFFWIHGVFIGVALGTLYNFLSKSILLKFWIYFLAVNTLTLGRGGTQGFFSSMINSLLILVVFVILLKLNKVRQYK